MRRALKQLSFQSVVMVQCYILMKNTKSESYITPYTNINSGETVDLNVKEKQ